MLSGCLSLGSNALRTNNKTENKVNPPYKINTNADGEITDISLLSAMIDLINNSAGVQEVYTAIPESSKVDLSLNDFHFILMRCHIPRKRKSSNFVVYLMS